MVLPMSEFSGAEPDTALCMAEEIISDLAKCSTNNKACKYGLPAGTTTTYCLHPDFKSFLIASNATESRGSTIPGKHSA